MLTKEREEQIDKIIQEHDACVTLLTRLVSDGYKKTFKMLDGYKGNPQGLSFNEWVEQEYNDESITNLLTK